MEDQPRVSCYVFFPVNSHFKSTRKTLASLTDSKSYTCLNPSSIFAMPARPTGQDFPNALLRSSCVQFLSILAFLTLEPQIFFLALAFIVYSRLIVCKESAISNPSSSS